MWIWIWEYECYSLICLISEQWVTHHTKMELEGDGSALMCENMECEWYKWCVSYQKTEQWIEAKKKCRFTVIDLPWKYECYKLVCLVSENMAMS